MQKCLHSTREHDVFVAQLSHLRHHWLRPRATATYASRFDGKPNKHRSEITKPWNPVAVAHSCVCVCVHSLVIYSLETYLVATYMDQTVRYRLLIAHTIVLLLTKYGSAESRMHRMANHKQQQQQKQEKHLTALKRKMFGPHTHTHTQPLDVSEESTNKHTNTLTTTGRTHPIYLN